MMSCFQKYKFSLNTILCISSKGSVHRLEVLEQSAVHLLYTMSSKTPLGVIFGCMTFGREGEEQVRTSDLSDCAAILDTFQSFGHTEVDTSRFYGVRIPSLHTPALWLTALGWKFRGVPTETGLAEEKLEDGHKVLP
jgi:hypothetical protein